MLPRRNRLKEDRDFKRTLRFGRGFFSPSLRMKIAPRMAQPNSPSFQEGARGSLPPLLPSRFGFVISTKTDKRSTVRNRLKRQVREVVRLLLKKGAIRDGFDVVINIGPGLRGKSYEDIGQEVKHLLMRGGLIK